MEHLVDAHYVALPSQGNIYSLVPINLSNGAYKLIIATLRRRVLSLRYSVTNDSARLKPLVRDVHFTFIPNNAEIVSIDAFCRSQQPDDYVVGITLIKAAVDSGRPETYLNTYSDQDWETETTSAGEKVGMNCSPTESSAAAGSGNLCLDHTAQNCKVLELGFMPYQLTHAQLPGEGETVWILGGGDCFIHVLREDMNQRAYAEIEVHAIFPEFTTKLSSPPMWTNIRYQEEQKLRVSAVGCECGFVRVSKVSVDAECKLVACWELQLQGPISCIRFFSLPHDADTADFNLLVVCALQPSLVFRDVCSQGLLNPSELPGTAVGDAVLCGTVADVDLDGTIEVLLGTYGRQLLVFKWVSGSWELRATRTLPHPVHRIHYLDVTGDGVRELLILTPKGLHVFQHHLEHVENRIEAFFKAISAEISHLKGAVKEDSHDVHDMTDKNYK